MDTLTHALSGAVAARLVAPAASGGRRPDARRWTLAGTLAAAFPDIDFVLTFIDPLLYLSQHRGLTHSLIMLPLWALLLGWLCALVTRCPAHWRAYTAVCALGVGIHIAGDMITSYGTMILAPVNWSSYAWGTTFIIDPWLSGLLLIGVVGLWARRPRLWAGAALSACVALISFQAWQLSRAHDVAENQVRTAGLDAKSVRVYPQPVSPWRWLLVVDTGDSYHHARVDLRRDEAAAPVADDAGGWRRLAAHYQPPDAAQWHTSARWPAVHEALAREAWGHPEMARYRRFARYPLVHQVVLSPQRKCVWFRDMRFDLPGRTPPFRYGMCHDAQDQDWVRDQQGYW